MEFILDQAEQDGPKLQFSDEEDVTDEISDFPEESMSFYWERDSQNLDDCPKFHDQTRNPIDAIFSDTESYFGEDNQPELFAPEERKGVEFDKFQGFEKGAENFKKNLLKFEEVDNRLFYSVIYGLMFYKQDNDTSKLDKKNAQKMLGDDLYFALIEIQPETMLDKILFGFLNDVTK